MIEREVTVQSKTEVSRELLARIGADMFLQTNMHYPASATSQAIRIAILCREKELEARKVWGALQDDQGEIQRLTDAANRMHERKEIDKEVIYHRVTNFARKAFTGAQKYKNIGTSELERLLTDYKPSDMGNDIDMRQKADALARRAKWTRLRYPSRWINANR